MAVEHGNPFAAHALPTPSNTPYQTPSRGLLDQNSRHNSSSPYSDTSMAPFPPDQSYFNDKTDSISSLHNPRFSQNLDISFIGEIHALKKEIEQKDLALEAAQKDGKRQKHAIGELEEAIDALAAEVTQLREDASRRAAKERSLEKAKRLLESDSTSAMSAIATERDDAQRRELGLERALEVERTKKRSLEADLENSYKIQDQERQRHHIDARSMDRRNHILESRIKTLVGELTALQITHRQQGHSHHRRNDSTQESVKAFEVAGARSYSRADSRMSNGSNDDVHGDREAMNSRASKRSGFRGFGGKAVNGLSLAEELGAEESDEELEHEAHVEMPLPSPDALLEEELTKPSRHTEDSKARKLMGLTFENANQAVEASPGQQSSKGVADYTTLSQRNPAAQHSDAATQFTPPSSPKPNLSEANNLPAKNIDYTEPAANQSRKRVAIPSVSTEPTSLKRDSSSKPQMVSTASQTIDIRRESVSISKLPDYESPPSRRTASASTQTDDGTASLAEAASNHLSPTDVPIISIHPPSSRPPSAHASVVLPPRTRNVSCQVDPLAFNSTKSSSMQTEEIRVDKRHIRVPSKTRSKHTATRARSPARPRSRSKEKGLKPTKMSDLGLAKIPRRNLRSPPPFEEEANHPPVPNIDDVYLGKNDDGPLTSSSPTGPRRPVRSGSILAGFDDTHDALSDKLDQDSDDGFLNGPPIRKTLSKVKDSWRLVPQSDEGIFDGPSSSKWDPEALKLGMGREKEKAPAIDARKTTSKTFQTKQSKPNLSKLPEFPGSEIVLPGATASGQRSRAPSEPGSSVGAPPFPVPTRSSSRKIPISASDGAASPTPYSTSFFTARRDQDQGRVAKKRKNDLRKVQSAAAVTKSTQVSSSKLPPLPFKTASHSRLGSLQKRGPSPNQFILPYPEQLPDSRPGSELSEMTKMQAGETSIENTNPQTTVVDAIAQTMVGEWMWKYIRKRTSFGITETAQQEFDMGKNGETRGSGGVRHKRWVWLAPYERAVIWSGKQPTSGPALLGKGGRKLTIQSVLDVKDDKPLPKGSGNTTAFNRSILILTPERALKFTAVSEERHYIWLTALSFLSHSTQGIDDLAVPEPIPQPDYQRQRPPSQGHPSDARRSQVRDSIRLAKAKSRPSMGPHSFSSPPEHLDKPSSLPHTGQHWDEIAERPSEDAAEPPQILRMAPETRRRSSTGPRNPLSSLTGYHNSTASGSTFSLQGSASVAENAGFGSKKNTHSRIGSGPSTRRSSMTRSQIVEATLPPPLPPPVRNDFFDAVGTVRMEAFIDYPTRNDPNTSASATGAVSAASAHPNRISSSTTSTSTTLGTRYPGIIGSGGLTADGGGDGKKKQHGHGYSSRKKENKKNMSYWGVPESPAFAASGTAPGSGAGTGADAGAGASMGKWKEREREKENEREREKERRVYGQERGGERDRDRDRDRERAGKEDPFKGF